MSFWTDIMIAVKRGLVASKDDLANYLPINGTANNSNALGGASLTDVQGWVDTNYFKNTGGTITKAGSVPLILNNTANAYTYLGYQSKGTLIGRLGFKSTNVPSIMTADGSAEYVLHHDGNSAKVAIQSSAPTDTSALWVY